MSHDVFGAVECEGAGGVTYPCSMVEIRVSESVLGADRPLFTDPAHVAPVLDVVAGELDCPLNVGVPIVDLAPHVVGDFFPFLNTVVNLREFDVSLHIRAPKLRRIPGW